MSMMIQARKELALLFLLAGRGPRAQSIHSEPRMRREELFWSRSIGCTAVVDAEGLLRPSELTNLTRDDVRLPTDLGDPSGTAAVVVIRRPKTARRFARAQQVMIQSRGALK